jgi:hypothetical protein
MKQVAVMCALLMMSGCAYRRPYVTARNNWSAVERLPAGTGVLVHTQDGKRSGELSAVGPTGLVVREKAGQLTSLARPDVRRLYIRSVFMDSRIGNSLWDAAMFMMLSVFVAPFVHEDNQRKVMGAMAAGGAAVGATVKTSYRDYIIYIRSK